MAWAFDRFARAGLVLPEVILTFHDELEPCGGYYGSFRAGDPLRVDLCGFNGDRFLPMPRKMILHELGHAWLHVNVVDEVRARFLDFRGLETWAEQKVGWDERGFEHAAEVIAWALLDEETRIFTVPDSSPETFSEAYIILTGRSVPDR
jgi:hypothetical protein